MFICFGCRFVIAIEFMFFKVVRIRKNNKWPNMLIDQTGTLGHFSSDIVHCKSYEHT